ncbi:MAG: hypothetical protein P8X82_10455, partial [Gemmatimonadales bacterium]
MAALALYSLHHIEGLHEAARGFARPWGVAFQTSFRLLWISGYAHLAADFSCSLGVEYRVGLRMLGKAPFAIHWVRGPLAVAR